MTNAMIIENARFELLKAGRIGSTGRMITVKDASGNTFEMAEPEQIHTFQAWKALGYQVQKGQKAVTKFTIWKHTTRKRTDPETHEVREEAHLFLTESAFFAASQVAPI